jgi:hypothetical protein
MLCCGKLIYAKGLCVLCYQKQYYENNKQHVLERVQKYDEVHKTKRAKYNKEYNDPDYVPPIKHYKYQQPDYKQQIKQYMKQYMILYNIVNRDKILACSKQYYNTHKQRAKQYYQDNKQRIKEYNKKYNKARYSPH